MNLPDFMSFECFLLFESREKKKRSAQKPNTKERKRERTEQIRVERKEIETQCEQVALH